MARSESDAAARIDLLCQQITHHNELYYNQAAPEITDAEYDALVRELQVLEAEFYWIDTGCMRQLIHERFNGEHVRKCPQPAQG